MRRIVVAVCCKAKDLLRRLAIAPRILEPEELPTEAECQKVHDDLTLSLLAYHEERRLSAERQPEIEDLLANAFRRSSGSSVSN